LHPLRAHHVDALPPVAPAGGPPARPNRAAAAAADAERPASFPRRIDRIATEAQGRFVVIIGLCTLAALIWSAIVQIDKVTRGSGRIVTQQMKQEVQHLEGGIIAEIMVKEGDTVHAGQPLMRVENSFFKSELAQAAIEQAAKRIRLIRLQAETNGAGDVSFPPAALNTSQQVIENELSLFRRRRANLDE